MASETKYSMDEVKAWLKTMAEKGYYVGNAPRLRRTAIEQITSILGPDEPKDADWVLANIDAIGRRWANIKNADPQTLRDYVGRVKSTISDYFIYRNDPAKFKPKARNVGGIRRSDGDGDGEQDARQANGVDEEQKSGERDAAFKLPGSSYEELCKIVRAYAQSSKGTDLKTLSSRTGITPTTISENNAFLIGVGLITREKPRVVTDLGRRLGLALDHEMANEIAQAWRAVVDASEFLRNMVAAVRIRRSMEPDAFHAHIAYSAGARKDARTVTGAKSVVAILLAAGLLSESEGKIVPVQVLGGATGVSSPTVPPIKAERESAPNVVVAQASVPAFNIVININVSARPDELIGLGGAVRRLMEELSAAQAGLTSTVSSAAKESTLVSASGQGGAEENDSAIEHADHGGDDDEVADASKD